MNPSSAITAQHASEVHRHQRFEFGKNWSRFLSLLNEDRIQAAEESLKAMLGIADLTGKRFLDVGSGSGLFSLAARRLGATVHSFDFDPHSVACGRYLRDRYFPDDRNWIVEEGSVLDTGYLETLGLFDVVYSWGVLHHTGAMWQAIGNISERVVPQGRLFIAIYNDQGFTSRIWSAVKKTYNLLPQPLRPLLVLISAIRLWGPTMLRDLLRHGTPLYSWRHVSVRGMSPWHDVIDWVGGYPFEVSTPQRLHQFYKKRGFVLLREILRTNGHGCNEFVFGNRA